MRRREFLASSAAAAAPAADRRNAILVYCEQLQHNVGSFAGGPARTPNLEKFASRAVTFRTACTTTGLCSPNRAALFTGRLGHRTGLDDNCNVWHSRLTRLDPSQTTLIDWARRRDYFIGYFGKWHLGRDGPILRGAHRYPKAGFDRVPSAPGKVDRKPNFAANRKYYQPGVAFTEKPGFYATAEGGYEQNETARLAAHAAEFLREARDSGKPFFLTVSFNAVHPPYHVPKPYSTMYDPRAVELPSSLRDDFADKPAYQNDIMWPFHDTGHLSDDDWRRLITHYCGFVTMLDRALGDIDSALELTGQADSTMRVIVADHGDMVGAHNRFDKGPYCYDEIMRIPLLVRAPGIAPREVRRHVSSIDLNRTLAEWMRLSPDIPNADSRSLLPLMERGEKAWSEPDEAFYRYEWYNGLWFGVRAVRTHSHKYCFNPVGVDEFYDLKVDPAEMNNLAAGKQPPPAMRPLQERLLAHLAQTNDAMLHAKLKEYLSATPGATAMSASGWKAHLSSARQPATRRWTG
jgi:arylsulfatase A-like enzyme